MKLTCHSPKVRISPRRQLRRTGGPDPEKPNSAGSGNLAHTLKCVGKEHCPHCLTGSLIIEDETLELDILRSKVSREINLLPI